MCDAYWNCADVMEAALEQCPLRRLLGRGLTMGGMCWGRYVDGMWYPARLMNRYGPLQPLSPALRSGSDYPRGRAA